MDTKLNPRQELFIQKLVREHKPASVAYKEVYPVANDNVAKVNASRLLTKANVKQRKEKVEKSIEQLFQSKAKKAYKTIHSIMENEHAPIAERRKAAIDILNYAGYKPVDKVETKQDTTIHALTDNNELMEQALKAKLDNIQKSKLLPNV